MCAGPTRGSTHASLQWWKVIIVDVARQASKGCGDLIFSSHITFLFTFCWWAPQLLCCTTSP